MPEIINAYCDQCPRLMTLRYKDGHANEGITLHMVDNSRDQNEYVKDVYVVSSSVTVGKLVHVTNCEKTVFKKQLFCSVNCFRNAMAEFIAATELEFSGLVKKKYEEA